MSFPAIRRVLRLLSGGVSCYAVQLARRWRAYRQAQRLNRYQIPPPRQTLHRSAQTAYYNKVYKGAGVRPVMDARRCSIPQTMPAWRGQLLPCVDRWQVLHPAHLLRGQCLNLYRVSPAAVSMLPTPGGLRSGTGSAIRAHQLAHSTRRGSPAAWARRLAPYLFRAFAR